MEFDFQDNDLKKSGYEDVSVASDLVGLSGYIVSNFGTYVNDGVFEIKEQLKNDIELAKQMVDDEIFYVNNEKTEEVSGIKEKKVLGTIAPTFEAPLIQEYEESGLWNAAMAPFVYSEGGSWWAIPNSADVDLAYEFLAATFMNEEWLYKNLDSLGGFIGNQKVMQRAIDSGNLENEYFAGQNLTQLFMDSNERLTNVRSATIYDSGIKNAIVKAIEAYSWTKSISSIDEACKLIESEVSSLYPDLQIKY